MHLKSELKKKGFILERLGVMVGRIVTVFLACRQHKPKEYFRQSLQDINVSLCVTCAG